MRNLTCCNVRKVSVNVHVLISYDCVLLTAQELLIYVILHEIRGGAVGIVFTGFGTFVIKAQKVYTTSESGTQYHILGVMIANGNNLRANEQDCKMCNV